MSFYMTYIQRGKLNLNFKNFKKEITLHTACHSRAQNIGSKSFAFTQFGYKR